MEALLILFLASIMLMFLLPSALSVHRNARKENNRISLERTARSTVEELSAGKEPTFDRTKYAVDFRTLYETNTHRDVQLTMWSLDHSHEVQYAFTIQKKKK